MSGLKPSWLITERGFSLIELLGASMLLLMLSGTVAYAYIAILKGVDEQISRSQARGGMNIALEAMVVDLHHAFEITVDNNSKAIRFKDAETGSNKFHIYYLQNQKDNTCPSNNFDSTALYDLKRAPVQGNIEGNFRWGEGF